MWSSFSSWDCSLNDAWAMRSFSGSGWSLSSTLRMNENAPTSPSRFERLFHPDYDYIGDAFGGGQGRLWFRCLQDIDCLKEFARVVDVFSLFSSELKTCSDRFGDNVVGLLVNFRSCVEHLVVCL